MRKTLQATNETGLPEFMVPATITAQDEEIQFYISTVKTENRVFVKLDKVDR